MTKSLNSRRRCLICDSDLHWYEYKVHMDNHSEDLIYLKFSNNLADYTKTMCKICGKKVNLTDMRVHTKKKHEMVITEYRNRFNQHHFDIIERVFHRCGICQKIILLDSDSVASHLHSHKGEQKMTHKEYNEKFMIKVVDPRNKRESLTEYPPKPEPPMKTIPVTAKISDSLTTAVFSPNVSAIEVAMEVMEILPEHIVQSSDDMVGEIPGRKMEQPSRVMQHTPEVISRTPVNLSRRCFICDSDIQKSEYETHLVNHSEEIKTLKISNNLAENCKTICKICGEILYLNGVRGHIKKEHGMVITEYMNRVNQHFFDIIEMVLHRCGICHEIILLDSNCIKHHLENHKGEKKMTYKEYNDKFMVRKKVPKYKCIVQTKSPHKLASSQSPEEIIPVIASTSYSPITDLQRSEYNVDIENQSVDLMHFKFSNNLADYTKTACKICGKKVNLSEMRVHTKKKHGMQIYEYRSLFKQHNFDMMEKVFHRCGICQKVILLDSDSVAGHLHGHKGEQRMTHKEYNEKFMIKVKEQRNCRESIINPTQNPEPLQSPKKIASFPANTSDFPNMAILRTDVTSMGEVVEKLTEPIVLCSGLVGEIPDWMTEMEQTPKLLGETSGQAECRRPTLSPVEQMSRLSETTPSLLGEEPL